MENYEIGSRVDRRTAQPADFVYRSVCPFFDDQPDMVADILAEDRFFYDKGDPENDKSLYDVRAFEPYHGGTELPIKVKVIDKD